MSKCCVCMYVCVLLVCLEPAEVRRGYWISQMPMGHHAATGKWMDSGSL